MMYHNETKISMHVTEYKHKAYNDLVSQSEAFIKVSQFDSTPSHDTVNPELYQSEIPKLFTGDMIYCLISGQLTLLHAKIDSSD